MANSENTLTMTLPKIVHKMNACADGSILELNHPLFIEKYGKDLFKTSELEESSAEDLTVYLLDESVYSHTLSYDSFYVSQKGINIEVNLISGFANKYVLLPLLKFLLEKIREEQEGIFKRTVEKHQEQLLNNLHLYKGEEE